MNEPYNVEKEHMRATAQNQNSNINIYVKRRHSLMQKIKLILKQLRKHFIKQKYLLYFISYMYFRLASNERNN